MAEFSHLDDQGRARMVDVGEKPFSRRKAVARGRVYMRRETYERIVNQSIAKGNVLEAARIAGIMAGKKTPDFIPLCHPLQIQQIRLDFTPESGGAEGPCILIQAAARVYAQTGVEMEALTAVSVAALTIYDMCKSVDREMMISGICLMEKSGGKSGVYTRPQDAPGGRQEIG
ncbi:MAG: cyclic pyranopterin monophosphate synthase MoaC [Desulfosalsimonadaceae bacterium]